MLRTAILAAAALALGLASAAAQTETVIVRGSRDASSPDICLRIADAKVKEDEKNRLKKQAELDAKAQAAAKKQNAKS